LIVDRSTAAASSNPFESTVTNVEDVQDDDSEDHPDDNKGKEESSVCSSSSLSSGGKSSESSSSSSSSGDTTGTIALVVGGTKGKRDRKIYNYDIPWRNDTGQEWFVDELLEKHLQDLAKKEFNGTPANGLKWKKEGVTRRVQDNQTRQVHKCHFKNESNCDFQLCVVRDVSKNLSAIFIGNRPHADHTVNKKSRGVSSKLMSDMVSSPNTLRQKGCKTIVSRAMHEQKINLHKEDQEKVRRAVYRMRRKFERSILDGLDGATFEGLARKLDSYKRDVLEVQEDFDEHTFFLCGDYRCDGTEKGNERISAFFQQATSY
jgi:hypothetical protein